VFSFFSILAYCLSVVNNIEWDAVELPSQFMENFCYDHKTLYSFAKHYESNEPLPEELFQKIKKSKNFQAGLQMIRQLYFGAMDMALHSTYDPHSTNETPFQVQKRLSQLYTVIPPLPEDRFLCSFSHIFAGGYSAGYYSYKWAEVMSADAFAAFEEVGLENEEKVKEVGRRFRETVLAMGGSKHPAEVFKAFRGRDPSPLPLLRHSGLIE
jgi:oligopeptidase A